MDIRIIMHDEDALEARDFLLSCILIVSDVETLPQLGLMNVVGYCGLRADGMIRTFVFPLYVDKNPAAGVPVHLQTYLEVCMEINASGIPMGFQNGPYDLTWFVRYNMPAANYAYDSMSMFWAKYPELPRRLDFISSILLDDYVYWKGDRKSDDWTTHLLYNGKDCDRTMRCILKLVDMMLEDDAMRINWAAAHRRVITALSMSLRGMLYSQERVEYHHENLKKDADAALERLQYLVADEGFNPNSPAQKSKLFYEILGAKKRNAKGRFVSKISDASAGAVALRAARSDHPIIRRVVDATLKAGEPAKQISNVVKIKKAPWGRVFTGYNGVGTTTSRLSSSEPPHTYGTNFQNIRGVYRDWITADPDSVLFEIDLSAGDDVFVSFESGDPEKIALFRSGRDTHAVNATLFFPNWSYEDIIELKGKKDPRIVHPITGIRQITKKLAHGCNYLMAAMTLLNTAGRDALVAAAKEWGHDSPEAWPQSRFIEFCEFLEARYRDHYIRFKRAGRTSWYEELAMEHRDTGGFLSPFGYFQRFLGGADDQNVLRAVAATAGQAGTAGRINMAMDELDYGVLPDSFRDGPNPHEGRRGLPVSRRDHGISMRLQTHDSLTFNVNLTHSNWREGVSNIFEVLQRPVVIRNSQTGSLEEFVLGIEADVGPQWGKGMTGIKENSLAGFEKALANYA